MASIHTHKAQCIRRESVRLHAKGTFGSSGAVTDGALGCGATISKVAATTGRYTVTFAGKYAALLGISFGVAQVSGTAADTGHWTLRTDAALSAGTIELNHTHPNDPTVLTDPASGDVVFVTIDVANSTVK